MYGYDSYNEGLLGLGIGLGIIAAILVVMIGVAIFIILQIQSAYQRIPREHRKMEPSQVWLMLIPCFGIIWIFFVFPRLSQSFKSYFNAQGVTDVGDCGESLGLIYCILTVTSIIPFLGYITSLAALVVLIIFLVKINELKNRIPPQAAA